jgi:XRE family transcriptional regulator, regulator of sulfur utilization
MSKWLGLELQRIREEHGLTLLEASEKTGVSCRKLSELERGLCAPHMPTLTKIARGYGVPVEELLDGTA